MTQARVIPLDEAKCTPIERAWLRAVERGDGCARAHRIMDDNCAHGRPWWTGMPTTGHIVYELGAFTISPDLEPDGFDVVDVYTGVTSNLRQRFANHRRKWWWQMIDPSLVTLFEFPTRELADAFEAASIARSTPEMNRAGRLLTVRELVIR